MLVGHARYREEPASRAAGQHDALHMFLTRLVPPSRVAEGHRPGFGANQIHQLPCRCILSSRLASSHSNRSRMTSKETPEKSGMMWSAPASSNVGMMPLLATPKHVIPAALAALTPDTESSNTRVSAGDTPRRSLATRKIAGSGFPLVTWSPVTIARK